MQEEEARVLKEHEEQLLKDLKAAVQAEKEGKKMTRQTKPAIVLENREPPEIPEFKVEEAMPSPYTEQDALWYMFRLSLFSRIQKAKREQKEEKARLEKESQKNDSGDAGSDSSDDVKEDSGVDTEGERDQTEHEIEKDQTSGKDSEMTSEASKDKSVKRDSEKDTDIEASRGKKSKSKSKKQNKKKESPPPKPINNQQSYERDPEVERILNEVVETLNRNMTPVQRRIPSRVLPRNQEPIRKEDVRVRYEPRTRPWPAIEDCDEMELPRYLVFTSTWLSVTAKGIK